MTEKMLVLEGGRKKSHVESNYKWMRERSSSLLICLHLANNLQQLSSYGISERHIDGDLQLLQCRAQ